MKRALNSVLAQTYKNIEIIIVDDGSIDNTGTLVQDYQKTHNNIRYIKHETSKGGNAARNTGIKQASGFFIAGLDDDDEFLPNRIEVLVQNYKKEYALITSRSLKIFKTHKLKTKFKEKIDLKTILYYNVVGNQVLVEREKILSVGLFDENLKRYQDYDLWLRIIQMYGSGKMIQDITQNIYYDHDLASNNSVKKNFLGAFEFYKKHRHLFNVSQRKFQLFKILCLQEKQISIRRAMIFFDLKNLKSLLKYFYLRV